MFCIFIVFAKKVVISEDTYNGEKVGVVVAEDFKVAPVLLKRKMAIIHTVRNL